MHWMKWIFTHQACISVLKMQKWFKLWFYQLITFCWFKKPSSWMLRGRFSFQRYKFGPYFTTRGPSIRFSLWFGVRIDWTGWSFYKRPIGTRAIWYSLHSSLKIRTKTAVRGSLNPFVKFGPNRRSVDSCNLLSKFGPIWPFVDPFIPFQNFR